MTRFLVMGLMLISATCAVSSERIPATSADLAGIKVAMDNVLKDADSAKLKNVFLTPEDKAWRICGRVNSKNSYGAYAGYSPFLGMKFPREDGKALYVVASVGEGAGLVCDKAVK
ncbi:hypothetical protein [Pseudomonas sp. CJQ_11]|uniref:hypothetical protein n=1 Tax=Pseudomonas sp. CJQ_11 TaxID=3367169 RepID=UPI00370BB6EA